MTIKLNDKFLSMMTPRFLAFFSMSILVPANIMLSHDDGSFINRDEKCSTSVFSGLLLSIFLVFHRKISLTHFLTLTSASPIRMIRVNSNYIYLAIICIKHAIKIIPMWPGFDSRTRRQMWVEFIVRFSSLLREVFLRVLRFPPLLKNQHFQIKIRSGTRGPQVCQSDTVLLSVALVK